MVILLRYTPVQKQFKQNCYGKAWLAHKQLGYSRKKPGGGGVKDMEFPGVN